MNAGIKRPWQKAIGVPLALLTIVPMLGGCSKEPRAKDARIPAMSACSALGPDKSAITGFANANGYKKLTDNQRNIFQTGYADDLTRGHGRGFERFDKKVFITSLDGWHPGKSLDFAFVDAIISYDRSTSWSAAGETRVVGRTREVSCIVEERDDDVQGFLDASKSVIGDHFNILIYTKPSMVEWIIGQGAEVKAYVSVKLSDSVMRNLLETLEDGTGKHIASKDIDDAFGPGMGVGFYIRVTPRDQAQDVNLGVPALGHSGPRSDNTILPEISRDDLLRILRQNVRMRFSVARAENLDP